MNKMRIIAIAGFLFCFILFSSAYVVDEKQQAFVTQFGRPIGDPITEPGIHFKVPMIQKAHFFEKRFLDWDGSPNEVPTKDKKLIAIDVYARWKIANPLTFFQQVTDELGAQTRLDDILDGATRSVVAANDLVEIVRSQVRDRSTDVSTDAEIMEITELQPFKRGRQLIADEILESAKPACAVMGIELLDIRFKRINYGPRVQEEIFNRMISERNRIAEEFRSEGRGEAAKIQGQMERELKTIESEGFRQAEEIRGQADADAISIYAAAYDQSEVSREYYQFMKTMETYESAISEKDTLILSTDSDLFKFLKGSNPVK